MHTSHAARPNAPGRTIKAATRSSPGRLLHALSAARRLDALVRQLSPAPDQIIPRGSGRVSQPSGRRRPPCNQSTDIAWRPTADLCVIFYFAPTAITARETPCEKAASSRGVPPEGRMPNRAICAVLPCWTVCVATCVCNLALMATYPGCTNLVLPLK